MPPPAPKAIPANNKEVSANKTAETEKRFRLKPEKNIMDPPSNKTGDLILSNIF
ncbi:MAG: hypothetical protein ABIK98_09950 [Pseudomonadota bacterium]